MLFFSENTQKKSSLKQLIRDKAWKIKFLSMIEFLLEQIVENKKLRISEQRINKFNPVKNLKVFYFFSNSNITNRNFKCI